MALLQGDFWNNYIKIISLFAAQLELHNTPKQWKKKKKKKKERKQFGNEISFTLHETLEVFRISGIR